jgi:hypothetical protein
VGFDYSQRFANKQITLWQRLQDLPTGGGKVELKTVCKAEAVAEVHLWQRLIALPTGGSKVELKTVGKQCPLRA